MPLRKISYFTVEVPQKSGQGLRILAALRDAGVNLLSYSGFPSRGKAQLDFVPDKPARFKAVVRKLKLKVSARKTAFLFIGDDRIGALTGILAKCAKARINLTALESVIAGKGRFGAIFWVKPKMVAKTAKLLHAK